MRYLFASLAFTFYRDMSDFLDLPPELIAAIVDYLNPPDCIAFSSSSRSLRPWRRRAWQVLELRTATMSELTRTLQRLAELFTADCELSLFINELYVREPRADSVLLSQLDLHLARALRPCLALHTFVLDPPQSGAGYFTLTLEVVHTLADLKTLCLGRVCGSGLAQIPLPCRRSGSLEDIIIVWTKAVDVGFILCNQSHLQRLHLDLSLYPEPDTAIGTTWVQLQHLSMGIGPESDSSAVWTKWIAIVTAALVGS